MRAYSPGGYLVGLVITAIIAAVAWFTVGQDILDRINESNTRSGGGGPQDERMVSEKRFGPIVADVRRKLGRDARLTTVTLRPTSAEFIHSVDGTAARGLRWEDHDPRLRRFETNAPVGSPKSWAIESLDPGAPQRIARAISKAEGGDFLLTIGDLQRANSGRLVWVMRGRIGEERGVAYYARPDGGNVKRYNPASPELSQGAGIARCIQRAAGDPAKIRACVGRFTPGSP